MRLVDEGVVKVSYGDSHFPADQGPAVISRYFAPPSSRVSFLRVLYHTHFFTWWCET